MRTLIVSCSGTKKGDAGNMPALARYDGPAYRTLRANLAEAGELRVIILSAEFGLIEADAEIPDYDRRMTPARARELAPRIGSELRRMAELGELEGEIFAFGGADYREALQLGLAGTPLLERIRFSHGGIGEQLGQLKAFLLQPPIEAEQLVDGELVAELLIGDCGPFVRVTVAGEARPWEMSARGAAVRTPMRRRYTLARSIEYVRGRLEAQQRPVGVPPIALDTIARLLGGHVITAAEQLERRGYAVSYRGSSTACPCCSRSNWIVGRQLAECGFCSTALPLALQAAA